MKKRKDVASILLDQIRGLSGFECGASLIRERAWASITFTGTRHIIAVQFEGDSARDASAHFEESLPTHEFDLPQCFVADAIVVDAQHEEGDTKSLPVSKLQVEILTILDV